MDGEKNSAPAGSGNDFASQIRDAEDAIYRAREAAAKAEAGRKPSLNWKKAVYIALIAACAATIYLNLPELMAASLMKKPLRTGSYLTDKKTDLCICNLWAIAAAMREGAELPALTCPVSDAPYIITKDSVSCPSPDGHGALRLYADKHNVIPFLEK